MTVEYSYRKQSEVIVDMVFSPTKGLLVEFPSGEVYGYKISLKKLNALFKAESAGSFFNEKIRNGPFTKYGKISLGKALSSKK